DQCGHRQLVWPSNKEQRTSRTKNKFSFPGPGGDFLNVAIIVAPARLRIRGAAPWSRVGIPALITHLGRETANVVFVQQVPQRAYRKFQQFSRVRLISAGATQTFK